MTPSSSPHHPLDADSTTAAVKRPVVLVTGATGRIGGELVDLLQQNALIELESAVVPGG